MIKFLHTLNERVAQERHAVAIFELEQRERRGGSLKGKNTNEQ